MKKFAALFLAFIISLSAVGTPVIASDYSTPIHALKTSWDFPDYSDVPSNHWAYYDIMRATEKAWFSGYPDGTFRPKAIVTRAEAVKVFTMLMGIQLTDTPTDEYCDVNSAAWYAPYVYSGGYIIPTHSSVNGVSAFAPTEPITREDTIYALVKSLGFESKVSSVNINIVDMFDDSDTISDNLRPYVAAAVSEGLIFGHANNTIGAKNPLTRAEFATIICRAYFMGYNF